MTHDAKKDVGSFPKSNGVFPVEQHAAMGAYLFDACVNAVRINRIRHGAFESQHHRSVRPVALAGCSQRAVQFCFDARRLSQQFKLPQAACK